MVQCGALNRHSQTHVCQRKHLNRMRAFCHLLSCYVLYTWQITAFFPAQVSYVPKVLEKWRDQRGACFTSSFSITSHNFAIGLHVVQAGSISGVFFSFTLIFRSGQNWSSVRVFFTLDYSEAGKHLQGVWHCFVWLALCLPCYSSITACLSHFLRFVWMHFFGSPANNQRESV